MFRTSRKFISRPFPMALLAYVFLISLHLPTALATPEMDDFIQLQFEAFGSTTGNDFEYTPVQVFGSVENAGIYQYLGLDGEPHIYDVVSVINITSMTQEVAENANYSLPETITYRSTMGWLETIDGDLIPVSGFIKSTLAEGDMFYLTGRVPVELLYGLSEHVLSVSNQVSDLLPTASQISIAPPTLHSSGCTALEEELLAITSVLQSTIDSEGDTVAINQATAIYELAVASKLTCEESYADALAAAAAKRDAEIDAAYQAFNANIDMAFAMAAAGMATMESHLAFDLWLCSFIPEVHLKEVCVLAALAVAAAETLAIGATLVILLKYYDSKKKAAIALAWTLYHIQAASLANQYDCEDEQEVSMNQIGGIFVALTSTTRTALKKAIDEVNSIRSAFYNTCPPLETNVVNGILLDWKK